MTLPASGAISFNAINVELCRAGGAQLSLNDSAVRTLFGQASGAVCMNTGHGKSNTSVPGAPTIGSASSTGTTSASVSFSAPASNGGLTIDYYQAISTPGCITATGTSPISVTGLSSSTSYTFKVRAHNSKGYGDYSGSSNSITTDTPTYYMCISTSGACVATSGNYKIARFYGTGSFTVNRLGFGVGNYGNRIQYMVGGGGGGTQNYTGMGGGGGGGAMIYCTNALCSSGQTVSQTSYTVTVGGGGGVSSPGTFSRIACGSNIVYLSAPQGTSGYGCDKAGNSGNSNRGGSSISCSSKYCAAGAAGGGGGANSGGQNGYRSGPYFYGGSGGTGLTASGNCFPYYQMGCGGGGGVFTYNRGAVGTPGYGGYGYGGSGGYVLNCVIYYISATNGAAYHGGGGGAGYPGKSGGSGFVVIRWRFQ